MNKIKILVISGLMFFSGTYLTAAQETKRYLTGQSRSCQNSGSSSSIPNCRHQIRFWYSVIWQIS